MVGVLRFVVILSFYTGLLAVGYVVYDNCGHYRPNPPRPHGVIFCKVPF